MALGPWNTPPNFLAAMSGGASAGLQLRGQDITARGQDIAAGEAADRLSLAYQQLASEEQSRAQAAREKMDIATAANAIKAQQIDMLNRWHQGQIDAAKAKLATPDLHFGTEGEITSVDPNTGLITQLRGPREKPAKQPTVTVPLDPNNPFGPKISGPANDPEVIKARDDALKATQTAADALKQKQGPNLLDRFKSMIGMGGTPAAAPGAVPDVAPIGSMPMSPGAGTLPLTPQPAAANPVAQMAAASQAAAPFKEGALIRNKKNGKLYRVTNGVPVEQSTPSSDNSQGTDTSMDEEEEQ